MSNRTVSERKLRTYFGKEQPSRWVRSYFHPDGQVWSIPHPIWKAQPVLCSAWWDRVLHAAGRDGLIVRRVNVNKFGQAGFRFCYSPSADADERMDLREVLGWEGGGDFDLYADTQYADRD